MLKNIHRRCALLLDNLSQNITDASASHIKVSDQWMRSKVQKDETLMSTSSHEAFELLVHTVLGHGFNPMDPSIDPNTNTLLVRDILRKLEYYNVI